MENLTDNIRDNVLSAIKKGGVKMRPRWHFVLQAALAACGLVILFCALLYLASFIIFTLRQTGVLFEPSFGPAGWYAFLFSLPWLLVALSIIFVIILEILVRRYAFAYRRPLLYSIVIIVLLVVLGGVVVERTHVHRRFFRYSQAGTLPFAGPMYRQFSMHRFGNIHRGSVTYVIENGFMMEVEPRVGKPQGAGGPFVFGPPGTPGLEDGLMVLITPQTRLFPGEIFSTGDLVVVFGESNAGVVSALGIRKIDE